uniref:Uncharacterized protein n=1 Tax=Arundo donax TaxID=35708 RepID=A0A0A9A132_ARUDO
MSLDWFAISIKPNSPWVVIVHAVIPSIDWIYSRLLFWEEHIMYRRRLIQELIHYGGRLLLALAPHGTGVPPAPGRRYPELFLLHHFQFSHNRSTDLVCTDTLILLMNDEKMEIHNDNQSYQAPQYQS